MRGCWEDISSSFSEINTYRAEVPFITPHANEERWMRPGRRQEAAAPSSPRSTEAYIDATKEELEEYRRFRGDVGRGSEDIQVPPIEDQILQQNTNW